MQTIGHCILIMKKMSSLDYHLLESTNSIGTLRLWKGMTGHKEFHIYIERYN